jgi:hypothetical protein
MAIHETERNNIMLEQTKKDLSPQAAFDFVRISHLTGNRVESGLNNSLKRFLNYQKKKTDLDAQSQ